MSPEVEQVNILIDRKFHVDGPFGKLPSPQHVQTWIDAGVAPATIADDMCSYLAAIGAPNADEARSTLFSHEEEVGSAYENWALGIVDKTTLAPYPKPTPAEIVARVTTGTAPGRAGQTSTATAGTVAQKPTPGRILLYTLSERDAGKVNVRRLDASDPATGNSAHEDDVVPFVVVRVWPDEGGPGIPGVNGQALLDGNDSLWVTSAHEGTAPGTWRWPTKA